MVTAATTASAIGAAVVPGLRPVMPPAAPGRHGSSPASPGETVTLLFCGYLRPLSPAGGGEGGIRGEHEHKLKWEDVFGGGYLVVGSFAGGILLHHGGAVRCGVTDSSTRPGKSAHGAAAI